MSDFDWLTVVYALGALLLLGGEAIALARDDDQHLPITTYVRRAMAYSHLFQGAVLGFIVWLFAHFAFGLG